MNQTQLINEIQRRLNMRQNDLVREYGDSTGEIKARGLGIQYGLTQAQFILEDLKKTLAP